MGLIAVSKLVKSLYIILGPLPKKVPLAITVEPDVPEFILTDEIKIFRSCVNFLTNACTVTEYGSVQFTISRLIEDGREKLLFECRDTGPGVPVETYPKLFKPIENSQECDGDSCLKPTVDGGIESQSSIGTADAGLGLYSVAVHISSLSGQYGYRPRTTLDGIDGSERSEQGSVFWFKIPLHAPNADMTALASSKVMSTTSPGPGRMNDETLNASLVQVQSTPSLSKELAGEVYQSFTKVLEGVKTDTVVNVVNDFSMTGKITQRKAVPLSADGSRKKRALVIEDSKVIRKSLTRVLTKLGFETLEAEDGMGGFQEMQATLFDIVFCDFLMPVMDGLDCVMQYRQWEATHRPFFRQYIVGISAHAGGNDVSKGLEVGMDDFWPKPVTYKQLTELEKNEGLQKTGENLDRIASEGTMMVDHYGSLNEKDYDSVNASTNSQRSEPIEAPLSKSQRKTSSAVHVCLVGIDKAKEQTRKAIEEAISKQGWQAAIVHDGEEALRMMRMRNWDMVILDEDLPMLQCSECVSKFREWEDKNRICRQRNIALLNASGFSTTAGSESSIQLPPGFDLALAKPVRPHEIEYLMLHASRSESDYGVREFVTR
jgi:CheY-like chemotaxis protein